MWQARLVRSLKSAPLVHSQLGFRTAQNWKLERKKAALPFWYHVIAVSCLFTELNHFHLRCLWNFVHIRWQDKASDTEVLKQTNFPSIITIMRKVQLRRAGHVSRMPADRIPKQLLYEELCQGKRTLGGLRKWLKDSWKVSLKDLNISIEPWESLARESDPPGAIS